MSYIKTQLNSYKEFKKIKALVLIAVMLALTTVAKMCAIYVLGNTVKLDLSNIPIAITAMMYGPFAGMLVGGLSDILQLCVAPGAFIPGITLSNALCGLVFGLFLYKSNCKPSCMIIPTAINRLVINLFLSSFWISISFGSPYVPSLIPKLIINPIFFFAEALILILVLPRITKVLKNYGF